jgi:hypothetical protein
VDNSWIKLYRKILKNEDIFRSKNTFPILCWLLLMADRTTGIVTCGRNQIAQRLKIRPSTVYLALKRMQNMNIIQMKPNSKMTTILILNWHIYQTKHDSNITTNQQQDNTKQEVRSKNEEDIDIYSDEYIASDKSNKKINSLVLTRGQLVIFAKEFGLTTTQIKEEAKQCSAQMAMSSGEYKNPGLYFKGWLKQALEERKKTESMNKVAEQTINLGEISEEQRIKNRQRLADMKKALFKKL